MDYKSIGYCTSNEARKEEITITRDLGLFEWSMLMIKTGTTSINREVTESFVGSGGQWINKATNEVPNYDMQNRLGLIKYEMLTLNKEMS